MYGSSLLLFLFLLLNQTYGNSSRGQYDQYVLDTLTEQCPYLSTCSQPAQQTFTASSSKLTPCCQQCSCGPLCHVEGNCCPDVPLNATDVSGNLVEEAELLRREKCVSLAYPDPSDDRNAFSTNEVYRAIARCPDEYRNTKLALMCEGEVMEKTDQVLLGSDHKNTIYRNVYCAQCNGALGFKRWPATVTCMTAGYPRTAFDPTLAGLEKRNCVLQSQLPRPLRNLTNSKRCFLPDISTCNISGDWDVYNEFTKRACLTGSATYYLDQIMSVYKNIFCFLCNTAASAMPLMKENPICSVSGVSRKPEFTFTAVLNGILPERHQKGVEGGCSRDEIYDKFSRNCRKLICPPDASPVNGECVQVFMQSDGFYIRYDIRIKPLDLHVSGQHLSQSKLQETMRPVNEHIIKKLQEEACALCESVLFKVPFGRLTYILQLNVKTTVSCPISYILKSMLDLSKTNVSVSMNGDTVSYGIENIEEFEYAQNTFAGVTFINSLDNFCFGIGVLATAFKCPRVKITGLDYMAAFRNDHIRKTSHYERYNLGAQRDEDLSNVTFEICVTEYFPASSNVIGMHAFVAERYQILQWLYSIILISVTKFQ